MAEKKFDDVLNRSRGYGAFEEKEKEVKARQKDYVPRFWLPSEKETKIVFLDDNPPIIEEHQLKISGDWRNWVTCLRIIGEACPVCDILEDSPYTIGFYTILDLSEFTDRQGQKRKNEKKLLPAKFKTLQMFRKYSKKRDGLQYCMFDVSRSSADSFNIGDIYDFEERLSESEAKKLNSDITPFDYAEILKPKSAAEIKEMLKISESSEEEAFDEDGVNF